MASAMAAMAAAMAWMVAIAGEPDGRSQADGHHPDHPPRSARPPAGHHPEPADIHSATTRKPLTCDGIAIQVWSRSVTAAVTLRIRSMRTMFFWAGRA